MATMTGSFFDNEILGFRLWTKDLQDLKMDQQVILATDSLKKMSKKCNKWKSRHFILTEEYLLYFKDANDKTPRGAMKLNWVRTVFVSKDSEDQPFNYGIRFIKNGKYSDLWTDSEEVIQRWKQALPKVCIQCDFHTKYTAIKMIGKGSFARVYLVDENNTKNKYAVKAFSKEYLLAQDKGKESLINEIEIMRQLDHKNIMRMIEVHESQNSIYLVMELLEGGELLSYINGKNSLKSQDIAKVMRNLLEALAYISSKNIMHRDLKPENMILQLKGDENVLKVVDFGLATKSDIKEYMFKRCGTPGFVAPEIINAPSIGSGPFEGKSFKEIISKNKACNIAFNHKNLLKAPASCIDLLKKMLTSDPHNRPSAEECLNHEFLYQKEDVDITTDIDEGLVEHLKEFQEKYKKNFQNMKKEGLQHPSMVKPSLEFRSPAINGKVDTVQDSVDFDPSNKKIDSLHFENAKSMNSPLLSEKKGAKRESIYKAALLAQLKNANLEEAMKRSESCDSQSDNTNSDEEGQSELPKKSKFGPKI